VLGHRKVRRVVAAALTAGTMLAGAATAEAQRAPSMGEGAPVGQSGIQLYNFRDYLSNGSGEILCPASPAPPTPYCTPALPPNTVMGRMERLLAFLQANDIKNVELYGFPGNPFPSSGNPQGNLQGTTELRALGDKYGIRFPARHGALTEARWDAEIAHAKILGQDHIGEGSLGGIGGVGSYAQTLTTAQTLNRLGKRSVEAGLGPAYFHNHNAEFSTRFTDTQGDGTLKSAWEIVMERTDPRYVVAQIDIGWAVCGASGHATPVDPGVGAAYVNQMIQKFGRRVISFHVKDMDPAGIRPSCGDADQRTLGQGGIDFGPMFASGKNKTRYYFSERDPVAIGGPTNFNPFVNAGDGAKAMRADPAPSLKAAPKHFPSVPVGTPASENQAPINVTNDGDAPLVIASGADALRFEAEEADGGAATAADFAVVSEDCRGKTLAPGASCTINVGFKPTREGFTSVARLVIDANGDDAVERVLVAGTQTAPDTAAPTVIAQINGRTPETSYTAPVTFTVRATDGAGATGVEWIERRIDGGAWVRADNTSNVEPFETSFTVSGNGSHTVEFRARDRAGNVSEPVGSITFTITVPTSGCNPLSDQFDGGAVDPKWQLINPVAGNPPTVVDGHLRMPMLRGDLYQEQGTAQTLLQPMPSGSWVATAKFKHANINADGKAAGLALINTLNPNYLLKTAVQYKNDVDPNTPGNQNGKWAERVLTANNQAITLPPATVPWPNSGALNLTGEYVYVRFVYDDATKTITTWSSANGTTFASFGAPISVTQYLSQPGGLRVGVFSKHDGSADSSVDFDAFNVVAGADPQTPGDSCGGLPGCPQGDEFDGTALDPKWEIVNPTPANLAVADGKLSLTTAQGDVNGASFTARNILLQAAPAGPWQMTAKLDHTTISQNGRAGGIVLYGAQSPNYFAKFGIQYKTTDLSGNPMNGIWAERALTSNGANNNAHGGQYPNSGKLTPPTADLWLRATYDGTSVTTEYSLDGTTFSAVGPAVPVNASTFGAGGITKIGLFVKHDGGGTAAPVRFDSFAVSGACDGADTVAARTTHTLDPASADGAGGWYKSPVRVTLSATDNEGGSGVDYVEYRNQGASSWTRYSAPFTVSAAGSHTIEYRSVDKAGNVEPTRSVAFKLDATAPTTTAKLNGEAPQASYTGPVTVDLDATDGSGSGVARTEVRVDGGEWRPYAEEETILATQTDLAKWGQTGPGGLVWNAADGGFFRSSGGMGMPWYPVKEYGDFALRFQWRDSSTGSNGNGGAFVRFPDPVEAVTRTAANRYPCQVGSAQSDPSWVAIYCGHEIQVNDHQGDAQKTGSVYNFSPLNAEQAKTQPRGTWVDYEIKVVGQTYTISRNGEVLQVFENTPGKASSRAGDPSTTDRQFAKGYIGLQNHGASDVIDYRNVRVQPLDAGSVQGPFEVTGTGAHTVEFRSTDVAGNVETAKSVEFTIGPEGEQTPPVTTASLNPASPGAGGTYSGPVDITLSAIDPAEAGGGGGAPSTVDITATPSLWEPAVASAKVGDTVRWNFPASASVPHDLWAIKPGESPLSDGTALVTGPVPVVIPPAAPIDTVVDQAGTWTFVCKVHGHKGAEGWEGMVAKVDVASGAAAGSGVEYTEYRINGGEWTRNTNTADASPFVTTFRAAAEGDYAIEYRSADRSGNVETAKAVSFRITEPSDSVSEEGEVVAPIARVLGITLSGPIDLGALLPGVARDYDASTTVLATSSLPASSLTVHDHSATATGHLVNGTYPLPQALKIGAGSGPLGALGGAANPTLLASWAHPLANEAVELKFRQSVAATDRLLMGNYGKRVTLTLSATTP